MLEQHPGVVRSAIALREDEPGQKRLVAYSVAAPTDVPTVRELRRHLAASLPDYIFPAALASLPRLPLTPNGKLDHHALPKPGQADMQTDCDRVAHRPA